MFVHTRMKPLAVAVVLAFVCVSSWAEEPIAIGPYVQNVTTNSAVVCWATVPGTSKVTDPDGSTRAIRRYEHHELSLTRLKPDTTYSYDVLGSGDPAGVGKLTTFPEGAEPFRFAVLGDTRSNHEVHGRIVKHIIGEKPRFVINSGDLVSDGRNIADWEAFFKINRELMRSLPYYPVPGNHEKDSGFYYDFFSLPGNERYYMFSVGDALFLMLDLDGRYYETPEFMNDREEEAWWDEQNRAYFEKEKAWVKSRLELTKGAGFVFVVGHSPMYSVKRTRVMDAKLRRAFWGDLFERYGVQVVLAGHDHHYHRAVHGGTNYVTTAGGGAGLYDPDRPQPESVKWAKVHHYMVFDIGDDEATARATDIDGNLVEEFTVERRRR